MNNEKKIIEWEPVKGFLVVDIDVLSLESVVTEAELKQLLRDNMSAWKGVNHSDRRAYLQSKDLPITRSNMLDGSL